MLFDTSTHSIAHIPQTYFYFECKSDTEDQMLLEVNTYSKQDIIPHIPLLQEWVKREYIHYPFLWVPSDQECCMDMFVHEKTALVTIVKKQGRVVGVAAGMKFDAKVLETFFEQPIALLTHQQGFNSSKILYMFFFLTAPEYRNDKHIVDTIYHAYVEFAKTLGLQQLCYWTDLGNEEHPLKPSSLIEVEPWEHIITGFKEMNIQFDQVWPTLQVDESVKSETHRAVFYIKDL